MFAFGKEPQWVGHVVVALVVVPATAGTATAPVGTAAIARTANAVRIGLRMVCLVRLDFKWSPLRDTC
ncbi:hypothetical protein GCM10027269_77410 [Kribbella endophytica]